MKDVIINEKSKIGGQSIHGNVYVGTSAEDQSVLIAEILLILKSVQSSDQTSANKLLADKEMPAAVEAIKSKDEAKAKQHLRNVGYWVLDFANKVGANAASQYILSALRN